MSDNDKPVDGFLTPSTVGERVIDKPELPKGGIFTDQTVSCEMVGASLHLKKGTYKHFEVLSDEAAFIGGKETAPSPMTYLAMATGF